MFNWNCLNLDYPGLEEVKFHYTKGNEPAALKALETYFSKRKQPGFLTNSQEFPKDVPKDIKIYANRLLNRTFVYDKPWDMEKCFEPIHFSGKINWHHTYQNDPEWMFMLNRQNFLLDLVLTYLSTKTESYLNSYTSLMEEWLLSEEDYHGRENSSWRTIDTGIRLKNWCKQLEFILPENVLSGEFILKTLSSILKQIIYLLEVFPFSAKLTLSNWRILEFHGAYIAATFFPELKDADKFQKIAQQNLEICLPLQVTNDGFHWEQSYMYHHEVLLNSLEALQVAECNHQVFSSEFIEILNNMLHASTHLIAPNFQQLCYGDSDIEDMRYLLTLGLLILKPNTINSFGLMKKADFYLMMDYGTAAQEELDKIFTTLKEEKALDFKHEDVGNYFIRNSWKNDSDLLFFKNGFLGGGHGHNDLLHFSLFMNGEPFLIDSGRYTYKEGDYFRFEFKKSSHHNTITMDHKEYSLQKEAWDNLKTADEVKRPVVFTPNFAFVQGQHLGYAPETILNRKIIAFKNEGIYFLTDEILSADSHEYQQHFHFPTPSVSVMNNSVLYQKNSLKAVILPLSEQKISLLKTEVSPCYNFKKSSQKIELSKTLEKNDHLDVLIANSSQYKVSYEKRPVTDMLGNIISETFVSCYKIKTPTKEYLLLCQHFEPHPGNRKLYVVDNIPLFGKTIICQLENDTYHSTVLEY